MDFSELLNRALQLGQNLPTERACCVHIPASSSSASVRLSVGDSASVFNKTLCLLVGALTLPGSQRPPADTPVSPESRQLWPGCSWESRSPPRSCLPAARWGGLFSGARHCRLAWRRACGSRSAPLLPLPRVKAECRVAAKSSALLQSAVTPGCRPHPRASFGTSHSAHSRPGNYRALGQVLGACQEGGRHGPSRARGAEPPKDLDHSPLQPKPGPSSEGLAPGSVCFRHIHYR